MFPHPRSAKDSRERHLLDVNVFKLRIVTQRDVLDLRTELGKGAVVVAQQHHLGATQGGVSSRLDPVEREVQQPDATGAGAVNVITESTCQVEACQVGGAGAP